VEFVCADPNAVVRAANVRATLDAFDLLPSVGRAIIERHQLNLGDLRPENFVPVQRWLDALKEIQQEIGTNVVRRVGTQIFTNAAFPEHYDSVETVLEALDQIYYLNHKGEVGHYRTAREHEGAMVVRCETPYPRHFEWGLIEGICKSRLARGVQYRVDFEEARTPGTLTCIVVVTRLGSLPGTRRPTPAPVR
jgi:hypothetical protein